MSESVKEMKICTECGSGYDVRRFRVDSRSEIEDSPTIDSVEQRVQESRDDVDVDYIVELLYYGTCDDCRRKGYRYDDETGRTTRR